MCHWDEVSFPESGPDPTEGSVLGGITYTVITTTPTPQYPLLLSVSLIKLFIDLLPLTFLNTSDRLFESPNLIRTPYFSFFCLPSFLLKVNNPLSSSCLVSQYVSSPGHEKGIKTIVGITGGPVSGVGAKEKSWTSLGCMLATHTCLFGRSVRWETRSPRTGVGPKDGGP